MRIFYIVLLFFISIATYGQQRHIDISWADENLAKTSVNEALVSPQLTVDPEGNWTFTQQWKDTNKANRASARLTNVRYGDVPAQLSAQLKDVSIPSTLDFSLDSRKGRDVMYTVLALNPIVKKDGRLQRVTGFDIEYAFAKAQSPTSRMAITNSVLASNDVYKFFVEETGVHRINRSFLQSIGMNTNNINPAEIKVFGLGGAPLPFRNSDNTEFDLGEIAIRVVGGEDGSFDSNDYILFYGTSTKGYIPDMDTFVNPYADRSYYYITTSSGNGKRVLPMEQPTTPATTTFTTFDDLQFHEEDLTTLVQIGRRWMGERFSFENEQSFEFSAPNPAGSIPAKLRVVVASTSESNTSFDVAVNGAIVGNVSIPGISGETFARSRELEVDVPIASEEVIVTLTYNNGGNPASQGYLDFISLDIPRSLSGTNGSINFKKNNAATSSGIAEFVFSNAGAYSEIWDVTNTGDVRIIENVGSQGEIRFKAALGTDRNYVAVHNSNFLIPRRENSNARVPNQDLKGNTLSDGNGNFQDVDYLMITGDALFSQASRLAQHNRDFRGLNVKTVRLSDIYEEFGGGKQDIGAIRNFVRYVYENASTPSRRLQYVCLFGDASVDYKNRLPNNTNFVPTFQTWRSFNLVSSFMSDDFFGSLDPDEGYIESGSSVPHLDNTTQNGRADKLDLAVGRIVADSPERARVIVDKILNYDTRESFGRWRNNFVLISDDVDEEFEFNALEGNLDRLGDRISSEKPFVNVIKIHSDAFQQVSSSGGDRYPQVNDAIANAIEVGALVVTYLGHGGEDLLAAEAIITQNEARRLDNGSRLPLLVTVTCEFTKFDNPLRETGGEQFIWNPDGGAVALVATTREISVTLGVQFNDVLAEKLFSFGTNTVKSVAENLRESKNEISDPLRRVIFFLGDPAMKLAFPKQDIRLTAVNDIPLGGALPNLRALDRVKLSGVVTTQSGQPLTSYNGKIAVTLYDKKIDRQTLGNDGTRNAAGELLILDFETLGNILYRGQASVENGNFETEFIMPRDTSIPLGEGRISFYAERESVLENQTGVNVDVIIGGLNEDAPVDNLGPKIRLFMNDEGFVNGGITNDSPFILAKLEDENGINTASGIGHDIVAIIDGDETNPVVMNDFYETEVDDFMRGTAKRKIRDLEPGPHTLTFKAWDVYNNSSTAELQFVVVGDEELELDNVLNYPNPFVNYTEFWFNHNRPFEPLDVQVQIFTVSGKVVKTINQVVTNDGFLSRDIVWDGMDDFGQAIGKGVYVYKLSVKSTLTNKQVEKFEKLVIL